MFNRHEVLKKHYREQILEWDWAGIVWGAEANEPDEEGVYREYLGSVFSLTPSGKYYTFWTTNQTRSDETRDEAFFEALDDVAEEYSGWIAGGEGDPCDLFFCIRKEE